MPCSAVYRKDLRSAPAPAWAPVLVALLVGLLSAAAPAATIARRPAQDAAVDSESASAVNADLPPLPALEDGQVARIEDLVVTDLEYLRYVGTVYARQDEGEIAFQQVLIERIVFEAAERAGVSITEDDVTELALRLDARARAETGGASGLLESLDADEGVVRDSLAILALQEKVIAAESGVEHPSDEQLRGWMDAALAEIHVLPAPLDDKIAARWPAGEMTRVELGRRIHRLLAPEDRGGVLTELLGVLLIRATAAQQGIELTPEAVAEEVQQRELLVSARDGNTGVSYANIVAQLDKLSLEELVATPRFGAEVLLRLMVEKQWTHEQLQALFEEEREFFESRLGPDLSFEQALPSVWREVRQRSYRQLFAEGRIIRRF